MRRIVFAVGLTGGHIYPARALADALDSEGYEFLFVARASSPLAKTLLEDCGFPVLSLKTRGLPRSFKDFIFCGPLFFWEQLCSVFLLVRAFRDWRPNLVVGFGGYVSFPAVLAAWILGIARIIFEPNAKLGLANKILARFSHRVACTFDLGLKKGVVIEPPLRSSLLEAESLNPEACRDFFGLDKTAPCVLVFGGSQGAHIINEAFKKAVVRLRQEGLKLSFIHIAGSKDYEDLKNFYEKQGFLDFKGVCLNYLEDMAKAYRAADLIVSRSGAMTCLEIMRFKKPAILVPLGSATESHQLANAVALERLGLAEVVPEDSQLFESLCQSLKKHLEGARRTDKIQDNLILSGKSFKDVVSEVLGQGS